MHPDEAQLNDYLDGALDAAVDDRVSHHLTDCLECSRVVAGLQRVVTAARALPPLDPPDAAWIGVKNLIGQRAEGTGQRAEGTGQRAEGEGQRAEGEGRRAEGRGQRAEGIGQRAEGIGQRAEGAGQRAKGSGWRGKWAWPLAAAAAVVAAFLTGRMVEQRHQRAALESSAASASHATEAADAPAKVRERVLLVAVGDHLERSQMVLVELENARPEAVLDVSTQRQYADELLLSNRLYRQTAVQLGQTNVADVLDDLERVLIEVARGPSQMSTEQLADLQRRIEADGLLFRVKIINSTITGRTPPVS